MPVPTPSQDPSDLSSPPSRFGAKKRRAPVLLTTQQAVYDHALRALTQKMRTEAELRRLLRKRVESSPAGAALMTAALTRLQQQGYLSDARYAKSFTAVRKDTHRLGQRRVTQELARKGVAKDIITETVSSAYAEADESALVRAFLARKRVTQPEARDDKARARVFRMLARAGFSAHAILAVFRCWTAPSADIL